MPAPLSSVKSERSSTVAVEALPAERKPSGKPANASPGDQDLAPRRRRHGGCSGRRRARRGGRHIDAGRRVALAGLERAVMHEQGRAIGADDLGLMPHVEIDVGVIVRRRRAHALELLDADLDPVDAFIVHEMWHLAFAP